MVTSQSGQSGEEDALESCYLTSLLIARKHGCRSVAFPLISAGVYGYPKEDALRVAVGTIKTFLEKEAGGEDMTVYLVAFDNEIRRLCGKHYSEYVNASG